MIFRAFLRHCLEEMFWAVRTTLCTTVCRAFRLMSVQLPYQTVMQLVKMCLIMQL